MAQRFSIRFSDAVDRLFPSGSARPLTRARLRELYDDARRAVHASELPLEGHSLPTTMNAWLARFAVKGGALKRDVDVVDFSFADAPETEAWIGGWQRRIAPPPPPIRVRREALELLTQVHALDAASRASLEVTNGTKDDLLAALSDLQAQVALLLQTYDGVRAGLRLPSRAEPLERFRASGERRSDADDADPAPSPKAGAKSAAAPGRAGSAGDAESTGARTRGGRPKAADRSKKRSTGARKTRTPKSGNAAAAER